MEKVQKKTNKNSLNSSKIGDKGQVSQLVSTTPLMLKKSNANALAFGSINNSIQKKDNKTGLPDNLKSGIESLSGHSMDDVKVHYNSSQPLQLNAHAFAQGSDIHVASGQEKHLPHEAWHVIQQKQGRVQPTKQMKGNVNVNDDEGLEKEADVMGEKALQMQSISFENHNITSSSTISTKTTQRFWNPFQEAGEWIGGKIYDNKETIKDAAMGGYNQVKNIGNMGLETIGTIYDAGVGGSKYVASGYTSIYAKSSDFFGLHDQAKKARKISEILRKSGHYDMNSASSHLWKAGKYGKNFGARAIGIDALHTDKDIDGTKGMLETLTSWKKDEKYNKVINKYINKKIGEGFSKINELSGGFFTYKSGGWQDKLNNALSSAGSFFTIMDEMWTKEKGVIGGLYTTIKGPVNTIKNVGKPISDKILKGDYLSAIKDTLANINQASVVTKIIEGTTDGTIANFEKQGVISKGTAKELTGLNGRMHKVYSFLSNLSGKKLELGSKHKVFTKKMNNSKLGQFINNSKAGKLVDKLSSKKHNNKMLNSSELTKNIVPINQEMTTLLSKVKKQLKESTVMKNIELVNSEVGKLKSLEGDRNSFEPTPVPK